MPLTLLNRTSGTMVSPWPPITTPVTFSTETLRACAMKVRKRALSRTPDRNAADIAQPHQRHHGIAVAAHHNAGDVLYRDVEGLRDEGAEARAIQDARSE